MDNIKSILNNVVRDLQTPEHSRRRLLIEKWSSIVGNKIAEHTTPKLQDNGTVVVWVNESALAFELRQRYQTTLLKRVQALVGEEAARKIKIYVGQIR